MKRLLAALFGLLLAGFAAGAWAQQGLQPIPPLTALAIDLTGTLDPIQLKGLDDKLKAFEREKGTQLAVLIVATTQPEDDASYANRVGNAWKIGRRGVGDGVLVLVAKNDRKIRIEVAKSLEGAIPDLAAKQIIDEAIRPAFRNDDYIGGLQAGTDRLIARIKGEALPAPPSANTAPGAQKQLGMGFDWMDLAIFLFIGVPVLGGILRGIFGRKFGSLLTGAGAGTAALLVTSSIVVAGIAAFIALVYTLLAGGLGAMGSRRGGGFGGGPWIGSGGFGGGGVGGGGGGFGGGSSWGGSGGGGDFGGGGASGDW